MVLLDFGFPFLSTLCDLVRIYCLFCSISGLVCKDYVDKIRFLCLYGLVRTKTIPHGKIMCSYLCYICWFLFMLPSGLASVACDLYLKFRFKMF